MPDGGRVRDGERTRIEQLAIPPAWKEVWICTDPQGHIQATGIDDAGRKQYLYHERWRVHRDREKFDSMLHFAAALPRMRRRVNRDLRQKGMGRERVLATAVRLLDLGFFRIGSERYTEENETYGLATLRRRHLSFENGAAVFDYAAKGSKRHVREVSDPMVLPVLRGLKRRRGGGHELLAFRNGGGAAGPWADVKSHDVNAYLKEATGGEYSAKDFRTWNATVLAAAALGARADEGVPASDAGKRRVVNEVVKQVASYLSNTPAVCRRSYIDPRVIDRFHSGETISTAGLGRELQPDRQRHRAKAEKRVLELLT